MAMKGLVFTEFMDMVEDKFGEDMVDDLIDATDPASGGSYTTVGTYDHQELVNMVVELSGKTNIAVPDLIKTFGHHLASVFSTKFSAFFEEVSSTIEFLKRIDNHIHVEVAKLYPDAELPEFSFDDSDDDVFYLNYASTRGLADLAHGLIEATSQHYQESFDIERHDSTDGDLQKTQFILRRV
jgi:hypothetical protein